MRRSLGDKPRYMGEHAKERKAKREPNARVWGWFPVGNGWERLYEPDTKLRDYENVELKDEVVRYSCEEVEPYVSDAWADGEKMRSAYEINFNRYFYEYKPPRPLAEIDADLKEMEEKILHLLRDEMALASFLNQEAFSFEDCLLARRQEA